MTVKEKIMFHAGFAAGAIAMGVVMFSIIAFAQNAEAAELQGWVGAETVTDGRDAVQIGITLEWEHVEFDVSHGVQKVHYRVPAEPEWKMDEWQSGTIATIRVYPFNWNTIRPFALWSHSSDITRGKPFNDENEPTSDFFGIGVSAYLGKRFEIEAAYGSLGRECQIIECYPGSRTNEMRIAFRAYFWK